MLKRNLYRAALLVGAAVVFAASISPASAADLLVRRNIDTLSAGDLGRYIHAVQVLEGRSTKDPTVLNSYAWYAALHNKTQPPSKAFGGPCEHKNDLFFPWHRAMLWYFEQALHEVDPTVTLPYWDWSRKPSGNRFPKAFEDTTSILSKSIDGRARDGTAPAPGWNLIHDLTLTAHYSDFAGASGEGLFEDQLHDYMHGSYVGGALSFNTTAGNDPVFWSFHAFIDALWWFRQHQPGNTDQITCTNKPDCLLKGMPGKTGAGLPGPTTAKDVADTATLGYTYDWQAPDSPLIAHATMSNQAPEVAALAVRTASHIATVPIVLPNGGPDDPLKINLHGVTTPQKAGYVALIYLHPKSVAFAPKNKAFREKYLVSRLADWAFPDMMGMNMTSDREFVLDRRAYRSLFAHAGTNMVLTIATYLSAAPKPAGAMAMQAATAPISEITIAGADAVNE
ncbi:MAG TPA: tyrosinase family protein [Rhizomicrobium sp.]|jgi:tyrosinase|nr:tyrosinase family protein [Rhizomicrobium sp.]